MSTDEKAEHFRTPRDEAEMSMSRGLNRRDSQSNNHASNKSMNEIYFRLRVGLMTFTLELATVWVANFFSIADRHYSVELPSGVSKRSWLLEERGNAPFLTFQCNLFVLREPRWTSDFGLAPR